MAESEKNATTTLHETVIRFADIEKRLFCHFDGEEFDRLIKVLEGDRDEPLQFYGFDLIDGLECYINLGHVTKINVLDYLAGLPFAKPPKKTGAESEKQMEDRENSDERVILRVWMASDGTIEVYEDIDYHDWVSVRFALDENGQQFVGFTDEDGERVILALAQVAAIEVFDMYFLTGEDLSKLLKEDDKQSA
jgi:hypothetical protein